MGFSFGSLRRLIREVAALVVPSARSLRRGSGDACTGDVGNGSHFIRCCPVDIAAVADGPAPALDLWDVLLVDHRNIFVGAHELLGPDVENLVVSIAC